jgi:hypothetical protein
MLEQENKCAPVILLTPFSHAAYTNMNVDYDVLNELGAPFYVDEHNDALDNASTRIIFLYVY